MNHKEFIELSKTPIKIKNPFENFKIIYKCSDGKEFRGDEESALKHESYLSAKHHYEKLSWFRKLFTKKV